MPKKTRQQKIQAQERRQLQYQQILQETPIVERNQTKSTKNQAPHQSIIKEPEISSGEDRTLRTYFMGDVRKSLILITGIIALEFIIYFGTINKYLASILKL